MTVPCSVPTPGAPLHVLLMPQYMEVASVLLLMPQYMEVASALL